MVNCSIYFNFKNELDFYKVGYSLHNRSLTWTKSPRKSINFRPRKISYYVTNSFTNGGWHVPHSELEDVLLYCVRYCEGGGGWDFTSFYVKLLRPREEDRLVKELSTMHLTVQFGLFWCFGSGHYLTPACLRNGDLKVENSWHRRRFIWQLIHFRLRKWRLDRLKRLHNLPT